MERRGCRGREKSEKKTDIESEEEWKEKIKQIGMQHTTTGGWNEGGVKLGQLGVSAPGGRVGSIFSLFLFLSSSLTRRHVHESGRVDTRART